MRRAKHYIRSRLYGNKRVLQQGIQMGILIPAGFEAQTAAQYAAAHKEGAADVEKSLNGKVDDQSKQICSFKNEKFNYFEANQQPFDKKTDGDFLASCKVVNNILYDTFKKQFPDNAKIDTAQSVYTVDGLVFQYFKMQIYFGDDKTMSMTMLLYNRLFGSREFAVAITYLDKAKGDLLLNAWKNSTFNKN
jgi:hypothetical protein